MKRIGKWLLGLITSALTLVLVIVPAVRREVGRAHHAG